jgi:hypothetical protein
MWKKTYYAIQWKNEKWLYILIHKANLNFIELSLEQFTNFVQNKYNIVELDSDSNIENNDPILQLLRK